MLHLNKNITPDQNNPCRINHKQRKQSESSIYLPDTVTQKLQALRWMQERLKEELVTDGYMDYGLMICQANGRPIMTEHLNQRFKDVLAAMNDLYVPTDGIVFRSIRHTSAGLKLKLSKGDVKAVQGDGG